MRIIGLERTDCCNCPVLSAAFSCGAVCRDRSIQCSSVRIGSYKFTSAAATSCSKDPQAVLVRDVSDQPSLKSR